MNLNALGALKHKTSSQAVNLESIMHARERLDGMAIMTPLVASRFNPNVFFKCEIFQKTNCFKFRGAYNKISSMSAEELERGVIAFSAGNHAQGVALAAKLCETSALIVMPENCVREKFTATKEFGADVKLFGNSTAESFQYADKLAGKTGMAMVHPYNDPEVISGQGTVALEILEQLPDLSNLFVQIGGGGLLAGTAGAVKSINSKIKVIGVEPEGAAKMRTSLRNGYLTTIQNPRTIADGLRISSVGRLAFNLAHKYVDEVVTVSDDEIINTVSILCKSEKMVVEPSGATGLAAILNRKMNLSGKSACILSGGNVNFEWFRKIIT